MMLRKAGLILNGLLFLGLCFSCLPAGRPPVAYAATVDRIAAVVNNEPIMESEVEDVLGPIYMNLKQEFSGEALMGQLEKTRIKILNQLIEDQLIFQEAEQRKVKVEDQEIDEMMGDFKKQFKSEEEMQEALSFRGLTLERLRKSYSKQIAIRKMHAYEVRSKVIVSPQQVESYYEAHKDEFSEKGHWLLSVITVRKKSEDVEKGTKSEAERAKIESVLKEFTSGKDFAELARKYSEDVHAKEGGQMGAVKMSEFTEAVEQAISKLEIGQTTGIIETDRGFHIFRLDGKVPSKFRELNDVRDEILNKLYRKEAEEKYKSWVEELKQKAYISIK